MSENNQGLDFLSSMGIDPQRVSIFDQSKSYNKSVDRRICICGHSVDRHKDPNTPWPYTPILRSVNPDGEFICQPNAMTCNCKKCIPVLKVSNPKYFLKRTDGAGETHALIRGILGLSKVEGHHIEWLVEPECRLCGLKGKEHGIVPAAFTSNGNIKRGQGSDGYDAFVCQNCRITV